MQPAKKFAGIKNAQSSQRNRKLDVGRFTLKVEELKHFESPVDGKPVFVATLAVVTSDNANFQPGDLVGHVLKPSKFPQYFLSGIKDFLVAVNGGHEIEDTDADDAVSERQPFRGDLVRAEVTLNKKGYPNILWIPDPSTAA